MTLFASLTSLILQDAMVVGGAFLNPGRKENRSL
jgi:hypothetical protein